MEKKQERAHQVQLLLFFLHLQEIIASNNPSDLPSTQPQRTNPIAQEAQAQRVKDPRFDPDRFKTDVHQQLQAREAARKAEEAAAAAKDRALAEAMAAAAAEEERRRAAERERRRAETQRQMAEFEAQRRWALEAKERQVGQRRCVHQLDSQLL